MNHGSHGLKFTMKSEPAFNSQLKSAMKRFAKSWIFLCVIAFAAPVSAHAIAPAAAGIFSIIPGLGQLAAERPLEGLAWFTTVATLSSVRSSYANNIGLELWEYNIYDAYRDAGAKDTSKETALENGVAFLNPINLIDPISVGVIGYAAYGSHGKNVVRQGPSSAVSGAFLFGMVGLGEEGLFRGFLFPGFSHLTNSYTAGAVLSSSAFAAAHLVNKNSYYHSRRGLLTIFAGGMLLCWQTYLQRWDLRHSIFTHAWFDFTTEYAKIGGSSLQTVPKLSFHLDF
jgi:membrane protease YdiL (CAAX protease family)